MMTYYCYNKLQVYEPPLWSKSLKQKPTNYVQLACRPTPIHEWNLPGVPTEFKVFIKRDDMTGSTLTGNKVRKLEFLLADALQKGCNNVVTCGGIQSNHSRATAIAARQLGLQPHLVLKWNGQGGPDTLGCEGNLLLDRSVGAKILLVPLDSGYEDYGSQMERLDQIVEQYMEDLRSQGLSPYYVPLGGTNELGVWGYIEAFREMMDQGVLENFDDIVMVVGSGGTVCGLAIANYLTGSKIKIHAIPVCNDADHFHKVVDELLENFDLPSDTEGKLSLKSKDVIDFIDGYKGRGYGLSTDEELAQLIDISLQTGVSLDPVYTQKGVRGMIGELCKNPGRFVGKRILYIHTGGVFGLYNKKIDPYLKATPSSNQVYDYQNLLSKIV